MTFLSMPSTLSRQRGLSLVELMVSIVLALIILGAISVILLGSTNLRRTDDDVSRMQENGRYAMEIIGKAIRQAGYRLNIDRCLGESDANPSGVAPLTATNGAAGAPDSIILRHDPAWIRDANNPLRGEEVNCAGATIRSNNNTTQANTNLVIYNFAVQGGNLVCSPQENGGAAVVLAPNVEDLQIEYGLDNADNGTVAQYTPAIAAQAANPANGTAAVEGTPFRNVVAVRVSLLLRGANANAGTGAQTYFFNGANRVANDRFLRQVYTATFNVRNRLRCP